MLIVEKAFQAVRDKIGDVDSVVIELATDKKDLSSIFIHFWGRCVMVQFQYVDAASIEDALDKVRAHVAKQKALATATVNAAINSAAGTKLL